MRFATVFYRDGNHPESTTILEEEEGEQPPQQQQYDEESAPLCRMRPYSPVSPYTFRRTPAPAVNQSSLLGSPDDDSLLSGACGMLLCVLLLLFMAFALSYPYTYYYAPSSSSVSWGRHSSTTTWGWGR